MSIKLPTETQFSLTPAQPPQNPLGGLGGLGGSSTGALGAALGGVGGNTSNGSIFGLGNYTPPQVGTINAYAAVCMNCGNIRLHAEPIVKNAGLGL